MGTYEDHVAVVLLGSGYYLTCRLTNERQLFYIAWRSRKYQACWSEHVFRLFLVVLLDDGGTQ